MHKAWESESPAARFMQRLVRERALEFMCCPDYLKALRFDYVRARQAQKRFGAVWAEFGKTVFQLIAEAYGETWDAEDEEKHAYKNTPKKEAAITQRNYDDLVTTREAGPLERQHELQGKPETSEHVLEEDQSSSVQGAQGSAQAQAREKARRAGRSGDFYARAGGSC